MKEDKSSNAILIILILFVIVAIFTFQKDDDLWPEDSVTTTYDGYDYSFDDDESDFEKWLKTNGQILSSNSFYEEEQDFDNWLKNADNLMDNDTNNADNLNDNKQKDDKSSNTKYSSLSNNTLYDPRTNSYSSINSNREISNLNNDFNNPINNNINNNQNEENGSNNIATKDEFETVSTRTNILKYYYSQLDSNQQSIYAEIEKGCSKNQSTIKIDKAKIDDFTIAS